MQIWAMIPFRLDQISAPAASYSNINDCFPIQNGFYMAIVMPYVTANKWKVIAIVLFSVGSKILHQTTTTMVDSEI